MVASAVYFVAPGIFAQDNDGLLTPVNGSDGILIPIPTPEPSPGPSASPSPVPLLLVQGRVLDAQLSVFDQLVPVAGATIIFINNSEGANNSTAVVTVSSPNGFYSVAITPGDYTIITSAPGFDTDIEQQTFTLSRTLNIIIFTIPFNGFIPYAINPVIETSPGGEVDCTMGVLNSQVNDQLVTFSVVTPAGWVAWFPNGESLLVPSGQSSVLTFRLKYEGVVQGPYTIKVVANGGLYFAEVPVIAVVKDLPNEYIDFYANSYYKEVSAGSVIRFQLHANNKYQQGKHVTVQFKDLPEGWQAKTEDFASAIGTRTDDKFFVYDGETYDFLLRVYVPPGTPEDVYRFNAVMCGDGVKSNELPIFVKVNNTAPVIANFVVNNTTYEHADYQVFRNGTAFINISLKSNWVFPVETQADLRIIDPNTSAYWGSTFISPSGYSATSILLLPGKNETITFAVTPQTRVSEGRYTAIVTLTSKDAESSYKLGKFTLSSNITIINKSVNRTTDAQSHEASASHVIEDSLLPFLLLALIAIPGFIGMYKWLKK